MDEKMGEPMKCLRCGRQAEPRGRRPIPGAILNLIRIDHPDWTESDDLCLDCLNFYRTKYVNQVLQTDEGDLDVIEKLVTKSFEDAENTAYLRGDFRKSAGR